MAVAFDVVATAVDSAGTVLSLTTAAFTIGAGSNRACAIGLSQDNNDSTAFTASVGGTSCSLVTGTDTTTAQTPRSMIFACAAPPSGSQTATASWTTAHNTTLCALAVSGADQATPMNNGTFAVAASGNPSLAVTSVSGDLTLDTGAVVSAVFSSPTQTLRWNTTATAFGAGSTGPGTGNTTHGWTGSGGTWSLSGANFKQATAASGAVLQPIRIAKKFVGPPVQRYRFRRATFRDTTVAGAATTVSAAFSSAAAATATFTTQSSAAVPFSAAGVATATFATVSSASAPFASAGVATATFNAQSSAAVAFASAGSATATFTTQSGAQSPMAAAGVATVTFTTQSSVATPFAIAGVATATFSTQAGASADFTMSGTATAIFTATTGGSSSAEAFMAGSATANFAAAALAPSAFTVSGQATVLFRGQAATPNQRPYLQWGKRPPAHETYDEEILALSHAMGSYLIDMVEGRYVSKAKIKLGKRGH